MKIYRLPINDLFRPNLQEYIWPPQNTQPGEDRGVEQDFDEWILLQDNLLVDDLAKADWLYAPVFYNRYYINTPDEDGHWGGGIEALSEEIERILSYEMPTFTISEADIRVIKPSIDWKDMTIFCASRRGDIGIDIPLLSAPHLIPELPEKKYLASFSGNLETDGIRMAMREELKDREDCLIEHVANGSEYLVNVILESYIALCPRGQGAQSFRMYEAMQLGTVPLYISDLDCRPFKNWIDYDICSFWANTTDGLNEYLSKLAEYKDKLKHMGYLAKCTYDDFLSYGKWCKFVIRELELL
jgi:hypothetical protein